MAALPSVHSVYIGQPKTITDERGTWISSIYRDRVDGPVVVSRDGLAGDRVAQPYHGGPDAAICVYLSAHYCIWNNQYGMELQPGAFGENLTLEGTTDDEVCVGDVVRVGSTVIQVSVPRVPCANLARRIGRSDWVKLTIRENRTGFYARIQEPGMLQAGDVWNLLERPNPEGSIRALNHCLYLQFDPGFSERVLQMRGLSDWWKQQVLERQSQRGKHWTASMKDVE